MVLKTVMKILKMLFLFLMLICIFSCEKQGLNLVYCPDCQDEEPDKANLDIKLSETKDPSSSIEIKIYEGNLEDNILYATALTRNNIVHRWVLINKKYTVTARYYISGDTYIVVNAVTPRVRYDDTLCDKPCWYVFNKVVDLRLKYDK
jgi:hypothetical protein